MSWPIYDLSEQTLDLCGRVYKAIGLKQIQKYALTAEFKNWKLMPLQYTGSFSRATWAIVTNYLRLYSTETSGFPYWGYKGFDKVIDLTGISSISIDWEAVGSANTDYRNHFFVVDSLSDLGIQTSYNNGDARVTKTNTFARETTVLDVSALSGLFYPALGFDKNNNSNSVDLRIHNIIIDGVDYKVGGNYDSDKIQLATGINSYKFQSPTIQSPLKAWDSIDFSIVDNDGSHVVNIVDENDNVLIANVSKNGDLSSITADKIKVEVELIRPVGTTSSDLDWVLASYLNA